MRLYIAEKPDMGRKIAASLPGPHQRKDGYMETGGGLVTWCVGHLLEQVPPDDYDKKYEAFPGDFSLLPIIPATWKLKISDSKRKQVQTIKTLLKQCSEVVNAGDPGREGQLIVDEVLDFLNNKKPVVRLLLPSLDKPTVQKAIAQMQNNTQFAPLYQAALCRQRADWLVGMNLTRSYTILGQKQGYRGVLSVGRVQTPTLAIVVRRDEAIESFQPKAFWSIKAQGVASEHPENPFWASWVPPGRDASAVLKADTDDEPEDEGDEDKDDATLAQEAAAEAAAQAAKPAWLDEAWRIIDKTQADRIASTIKNAGSATVIKDERKSSKELAPLPFELTGLQAKINASTGASVDDVLKACQSLYEAGYASYPRSDCSYLPTAIFNDSPDVLAAIAKGQPGLAVLAQGADPTIQGRAWNDAKVGEHYGIIPTSSAPDPNTLQPLEKAVYEAISRRFIAQFYPPCLVDKALIELEAGGERLVARGRVVTDAGWRVVIQEDLSSGTKNKAAEPSLPSLKVGQSVDIAQVDVGSHTTSPPPRFTEGTLTMAMKHVYRLVSDPVDRKKLKSVEGIGRSATRAAIIKNLLKRQFLMPDGKKIISSPAARVLVNALPKPLIDPGLTARWENALDMVANGKATLDAFMGKQSQWVAQLVSLASQVTLPPLPAAALPATGKSGGSRGGAKSGGAGAGKAKGKPDKSGLEGKTCSVCGQGTLRKRVIQGGAHKGKSFYGCSAYPACKHSEWPKK